MLVIEYYGYSDEGIPKNPVEVVQKIHGLTKLRREHWKTGGNVAFPQNLILEHALHLVGGRVYNSHILADSVEVAVSTFAAIVIGDRTGDLTEYLVNECMMLDFVLNVCKTTTDVSNMIAQKAANCLTNLYLRSRRTCALVSRFLPPTMAYVFSLTRIQQESDLADYASLAVAAYASYLLYPGAHEIPMPKVVDQKLVYEIPEDALVRRPSDFKVSLIYPHIASEDLQSFDNFGQTTTPVELDAEKELYNLDMLEYGTNPNLVGEMYANGEMIDRAAAAEDGDNNEEGLDDLIDPDLADIMRNARYLVNATKEEINNFEDRLADEDEAAEEQGIQVDSKTYFGVGEDPLARKALRTDFANLTEKFATANGEWRLYISIFSSDCQMITHQGIVKMQLELDTNEEGDTGIGMEAGVEAEGFWTIGAEESITDIRNAAKTGTGIYGSVEEAAATASLYNKSWWRETHAIRFEEATLDLLRGRLEALIARGQAEDESQGPVKYAGGKRTAAKKAKKQKRVEKLAIQGDAFEFGYRGAVLCENESGEFVTCGGFLILKPDASTESEMAITEVDVFDRLAHLPVKFGPLAGVDLQPLPETPQPDDEDGDIDILFGQISTAASALVTATVNSKSLFTNLTAAVFIGAEADESMLPFIFYPDPENESVDGPWQTIRKQFALQALQDCLALRSGIVACYMQEAKKDCTALMVLEPLLRATFSHIDPFYDFSEVPVERLQALSINHQQWDAALIAYHKWIARFRATEISHLSVTKSMLWLAMMMINFLS